MMNSLSVLFRDRCSPSYFSRTLFKFGASANSLDHLDCSHGILAVFWNKMYSSESKFLSPPMKTVVRTCACAIVFLPFGFQIVYVWCLSHIATRNQDIKKFTVCFFFKMEVHLPIFWESCSNLELLLILWIIWIAVTLYWQYFIIKILFQKANFSPHLWRQLLELALVLFFLTIWILDCLCLAHIATRNQDALPVLFRDGSSSSFFSRKLFEFGASAISLDNLDFSQGVLAVFYNTIFISGSTFLSPSMKAVVRTCACTISLRHLDFRLFCFWLT